MPRFPLIVGAVAALLLSPTASATPHLAHGSLPVEPFAPYQPATRCSPQARPGTVALAHYLVQRYGGAAGGISRPCGPEGATSEHNEGRALDWTNDATTKAGRRTVAAFLQDAFATDADGNADALARRMGIDYLIWNDRLYGAWNHYAPESYLDPSCHTKAACSPTLRHRDHLHISLTRAGGRGDTSWFELRADRARRQAFGGRGQTAEILSVHESAPR